MTARRYVSIDELAEISGMSTSTLRRRARDGSLQFFQPGGPGTRMLFDPDALHQSAAVAAQPTVKLEADETAIQSDATSKATRSCPKWRRTLAALTAPNALQETDAQKT